MATVWFAVGNVAEHSGFVTSRFADEIWSSENLSGWTYQDVTGPHGTVLAEADTEDEAAQALAEWLRCDDGGCYTHGSRL